MDRSLSEALQGNGYPGRGLVLAQLASGWCVVYFLTGRSHASRDRELVTRDGGLYVQPRGDLEHDPLRHYRAVACTDEWCVVGNGDQVDQIAANLAQAPPALAVQGIAYEPDPPLRTPRISVVTARAQGRPAVITRAYASTVDPERCIVGAWTVDRLGAGQVLVTTTYQSDSDRQVTATDMPPAEACTQAETPAQLLQEVWDSLPEDLRVAAVAVSPNAPNPLNALVTT